MLRKGASNLEVYREARNILDDFYGIDTYWYQDDRNYCAVTATILYQLLNRSTDVLLNRPTDVEIAEVRRKCGDD